MKHAGKKLAADLFIFYDVKPAVETEGFITITSCMKDFATIKT
jgi:hypothetical protein